MSSAQEIEERAASWLVRRDNPEWSDGDQRSLDCWLEQSVAHKAAFWRLDFGWRQADRISSVGTAPPSAPRYAQPSEYHWWRKIAVAATLMLFVSIASVQTFNLPSAPGSSVQTGSFATGIGGSKRVTLPDGSRVELNTDTRVRAEVGTDRRAVWLEQGEVFFDIAKRTDEPFVVYAGPRTITVLGTKFAVRRNGDSVTVAVMEGRVRVDDSGSKASLHSTTISSGDVAVANRETTVVDVNATERVQERMAWRQGLLLFDDVPLSEVAAEFNRYNSRKLEIADPDVAQTRIGGSFQARNVDAFARLLREAYGLVVTANDGKITVSS